MGCQCTKSSVTPEANEIKTTSAQVTKLKSKAHSTTRQCGFDISNTSINNSTQKYKIDYNARCLDLINQARQDPSSFADIIQNNVKYISGEESNIYFEFNNVKVKLHKGETAFNEAGETLRMMESLQPLRFNDNICIPIPSKVDMITTEYLSSRSAQIEKETNMKVDAYYVDNVKDADASILLMIVDDNDKKSGRKRGCILNQKYKYIGITHALIDNSFVAIFSFAS